MGIDLQLLQGTKKIVLDTIVFEEMKSYNVLQMTILVFKGNYSKWVSLKHIFCEVFISKNSGNIHKMAALKSYLRGQALGLVDCLGISGNNFAVACKILEERYDQKRLLLFKYFKKIIDSTEMPQIATLLKFLQRQFKSFEGPENASYKTITFQNLKQIFFFFSLCPVHKRSRLRVIGFAIWLFRMADMGANSLSSVSKSKTNVSLKTSFKDEKHILVAAALIYAKNSKGRNVVARAVLDNCSQGNFITNSRRKKLGLKVRRMDSVVDGIYRQSYSKIIGQVQVGIGSLLRGSSCVKPVFLDLFVKN